MIKLILSIVSIELLLMTIVECQMWNETDASENATMMIPPKPFVYYGRYHHRERLRRAYLDDNSTAEHETMATILSILPLDRLGALIGQLIATSFKEMLSPNVGKKILNVLEAQAPSLATSLFTNLYATLRVPARSTSRNTPVQSDRNVNTPLSNSSKLSLLNRLKRSKTK
ncbi:unnamed protein product [Adineta ricciae]|uniref:Uncharacterized protein n=1 Tax=Adineta ricciae TaxID=249248 RepID=A0A815V776_ADIRI|nr:unnamed protein product [Adineta ricciae]